MARYLVLHTFPRNSLTREQFGQVSEALRNDPVLQGLRSFANLTEGKVVCIMESPDTKTLAAWYKKMNVPVDSITQIELEGDGGTIMELSNQKTAVHA